MILRRKAYQKMLDWKNKSNEKGALLLKGARSVGKTFLCEQLGKNEYKSVIHIDFENISPALKDTFDNEGSHLDLLFTKLATYHRVRLYRGESLIIFDEAQHCPASRHIIKRLVTDNKYDYIVTTSLPSAKNLPKEIELPSNQHQLEVFPLDFEEFLWTSGDDITIPLIKYCFEKRLPLGQSLHREVMNYFRQYMLVGGMPLPILEYMADKDFTVSDNVKKRILAIYRNDISKYAGSYARKVSAIFNAIPGQLSKKEKKYKVSSLSKNARQRSYADAFTWLDEAMIINPCFNSADPNTTLTLSSNHSSQKVYMSDTGLLVTHAFRGIECVDNELYRAILFDKLNVNAGMLMENVVAQTLRSNGHDLFFYSRSDTANRQNMIDIDFMINTEEGICPIEVKSSEFRVRSSLDKFRRKYNAVLGNAYVLYPKDLSTKDGIVHLPLYMAMFL